MTSESIIKVYDTADAVCCAMAQRLVDFAKHGGTVALSGGTTPKRMFSLIAERYGEVDWSRVKFFWGDERMVPEWSTESNYGEFKRLLVDRGIIAPAQCFPFPSHDEQEAICHVEASLRCHVTFKNGLPQFDMVILGIGIDGHTASIFPDNIRSFHAEAMIEAVTQPQSGSRRLTLTGNTLNNACEVDVLAIGAAKQEVLYQIIDQRNSNLPATHLHPQGPITWFLDEAAAGKIR